MFPKTGVGPPNHPLKNRVFHYFHHPFWGSKALSLDNSWSFMRSWMRPPKVFPTKPGVSPRPKIS